MGTLDTEAQGHSSFYLNQQRVSKTQGALQVLPEGVVQEAGSSDLTVLVLVHDNSVAWPDGSMIRGYLNRAGGGRKRDVSSTWGVQCQKENTLRVPTKNKADLLCTYFHTSVENTNGQREKLTQESNIMWYNK